MAGRLTQDELAELEWYFDGSAERDCGVRSGQGGFELTMDKLARSRRPREAREVWHAGGPMWVDGDLPARETRNTVAASDGAHERVINRLEKLATARRIYQRIRRLDAKSRAVLELHFGDRARVRGVSVGLLCATTAVQEATRKVNAKRLRRAEKKGEEPPDTIGPREAVEHMAVAGSSTADGDALGLLVTAAKLMLAEALAAYVEARPGAAREG